MRKSRLFFDALDKIMVLTQDFQKKPILNLLEGKYRAPR